MNQEEKLKAIYEEIMRKDIPRGKTVPYGNCMIGDVLERIQTEMYVISSLGANIHRAGKKDKLIDVWNIYRDSIDAQHEECIDFIYSLLPGTKNND